MPPMYDIYTQNYITMKDLMSKNEWMNFKTQYGINKMIVEGRNPFNLVSMTIPNLDPLARIPVRKRRQKLKRYRKGTDLSPALIQKDVPKILGPYSRVDLPNRISNEEIAIQILLIDGIKSNYDTVFNILPKESSIPSDITSVTYQQALAAYHRVSQFSLISYLTLENVWNDLDEIHQFYRSFSPSLINNLAFYRLDDDFLKIKCLFGNRTTQIDDMNKDFEEESKDFENKIADILEAVLEAKKDVNRVVEETDQIRNYRGSQNLYSKEFERQIGIAIKSIKPFREIQIEIDKHLSELKTAHLSIKNKEKILREKIAKHKKIAHEFRMLFSIFFGLIVAVLI